MNVVLGGMRIPCLLFVLGVDIGVQKTDNRDFNPLLFSLLYSLADLFLIQWRNNLSVKLDPFFHLEPQIPGNQVFRRGHSQVVRIFLGDPAAQLQHIPEPLSADHAAFRTLS